MIRKINLLTALAALVLFFLPWIDIQCSNRSLLTQSGAQIIYGGCTPSKELKKSMELNPSQTTSGRDSSGSDQRPKGISVLVAIALSATLSAVVVAFLALRSGDRRYDVGTGLLCALALALIGIQMGMGFPFATQMEYQPPTDFSNSRGGDPSAGFDPAMAAAMLDIQVRTLPGLYLELVALGIPVLILVNGLLDRLRLSDEGKRTREEA